jgi:hypothetical protein
VRPLRVLIAASFALLAMGAGLGDGLLLCRTQKTLHVSCCCRGAAMAESEALEERSIESVRRSAAGAEALRRAPCCEAASLEVASIPAATGSLARDALATPLLLEVASPPVLALARLDAIAVPARLEDTPRVPTGPPKPILHRALLI